MPIGVVLFFLYSVLSFALQEGGNILYRDVDEAAACCCGSPGDVGSYVAIRRLEQGASCTRRLFCQDINANRIEFVCRESIGNSLFVEQRAASRVDEDGCRLHQGEPFAIDEVARLFRQRAMKAHHIRLAEELFVAACLLYPKRS